MAIENGGPSFPVLRSTNQQTGDVQITTPECGTGLSMRDVFAAHALIGLLSGGHTKNAMFSHFDETKVKRVPLNGRMEEVYEEVRRDMTPEEVSQWAYATADQMLAARQTKEPQ